MPRRYTEITFLTNGHSKGITAVAFNSNSTLLATTGLDANICVWQVQDGTLLYKVSEDSPICSLAWQQRGDEEDVIFGSQNGNIAFLTVNKCDLSVHGFWAHRFPVEHLAIKDDLIASGAFSELKVWRWNTTQHTYVCLAKLQEPPVTSHSDGKEILVTSLHWTASEQHSSLLMVTYMFHGVQLIEPTTWTRVRTISLSGKIGRASLSENGAFLAISNLKKGFDVYRVESEEPVASYDHDVGEPCPTPVLFIHGGHAIVGGSTVGKVSVWDLHWGKLHSLTIPRRRKVLAIAAHCSPASDAADYRFLIATGIFNEGGSSSCIIWEAQELDSAVLESTSGEGSSDKDHDPTTDAGTHPQARGLWSIVNILWTVWAALSVLGLAYFIHKAREGDLY